MNPHRVIVRRCLLEQALAVLFAGVGTLGAILFVSAGLIIPGIVLFVATTVAGVRAFRVAVILHPEGITVRNDLRTYRLTWTEIDEIVVSRHEEGAWGVDHLLGFVCVASIKCRDGRTLPVGVTRTPYQPWSVAEQKARYIRQ